MMRKDVLIAGLMSITMLGAVAPASAAPPEQAGGRWNNNDRPARQTPLREQRYQRNDSAPRAVSREPVRAPQQVEQQRYQSRAQVIGQRQERDEDRRDWRQDNRNDRQDWRQDNRNDRRDWREDNRNDRRDWRQDNREDRRDWRNDNRNDWRNDARYRNDRDVYRAAPRYNWDRDWRRNQRYDWERYRDRYRDRYRYNYYAPRGWSYGYRRFSIGIEIWSGLYDNRYWISDPYYYRLPPVYGSLRWVRYYDDALLVDTRSGYVVDVIYDFFW